MRRCERPKLAACVVMLGLFGALLGIACGTDAVGVDACKKVERVRCESAPACNINLTAPVHRGDSPEDDVGACIRYYDDQCLHGIVARDNGDPSPQAVDACVDAIINGDCEVVRHPESHPACSWLEPPAPVAPPPETQDAASEADASDAAADG